MKKILAELWPCVIPIVLVVFVLVAVHLRIEQAKHYTIKDLTYERVEPESEWKSTDYVIFKTKKGELIKYLCPSYIYNSMVYGSTYDVTIIDGDFSLPSVKVESIMPSL